ncbi:hypothetical protein BGZ54_009055, partial [Gamsiella multidivaricata]
LYLSTVAGYSRLTFQSFTRSGKASQTPNSDSVVPTYNILLLGQTQAGKSTFLQAIREYADPNCEIDQESIGSGSRSCTTEVRTQEVEIDFPEYSLYDTNPSLYFNPTRYKGTFFLSQDTPVEKEVTVADLLGCSNHKQYKQKIDYYDYDLRRDKPSHLPKSKIRVFDTPGLNDTSSHDERNVAKILSALINAGSVHLVLIMIARQTPLTMELKNALETYYNIFSAMGSLITIVHTKVDYRSQHHEDHREMDFFKERKTELRKIMGRDHLHHKIDCNLEEDRLAYKYLRLHTIRKLLLQAVSNIPVQLSNMQLCKTPKMIDIDGLIQKEFRDKLKRIAKKIPRINNAIKTSNEAAICDVDSKITEIKYEIREIKEFIKNNDTEDLELSHEAEYQENWRLFGYRQELKLKSPDFDYTIDDIHVEQSKIEIRESKGGKGYKFWSVRLMREPYQYGTYYVKLYVKRSNMHRHEIRKRKIRLDYSEAILKGLIRERELLGRTDMGDKDRLAQRRQLLAEKNICWNMITRAQRNTLHLNLFKAIADAGVYEGSSADCTQKVVEFYSTYRPTEGEEVALKPDQSRQREP